MDPRTLNQRIIIQQQSEDVDAIGQPINTWSTFAAVWADIRGGNGLQAIKASESVQAGAMTSIVKKSIRIRYRTDLDAGMRVLHGSTVYNINAVLPDDSGKEYCDLVCEVVA